MMGGRIVNDCSSPSRTAAMAFIGGNGPMAPTALQRAESIATHCMYTAMALWLPVTLYALSR